MRLNKNGEFTGLEPESKYQFDTQRKRTKAFDLLENTVIGELKELGISTDPRMRVEIGDSSVRVCLVQFGERIFGSDITFFKKVKKYQETDKGQIHNRETLEIELSIACGGSFTPKDEGDVFKISATNAILNKFGRVSQIITEAMETQQKLLKMMVEEREQSEDYTS